MPYGRRYTPRKSSRSTPRTPRSTPRKYTPRKNYRKKMPMVTFAKRVQAIVSKNLENKYTASVDYRGDISTLTRVYTGGTVYNNTFASFVWAPGNGANGMFNIPQGNTIQSRIGNKIKLKRWIIKGMIQPNPTYDDVPAPFPNPPVSQPPAPYTATGISPNSLCGFVDIYFGRRMDNLQPVGNDLNKFYRNGATDITPAGNLQETLYPINKDLYKVYYHKRFKVGVGNGFSGSGPTLTYDAQPLVPGANGFGLTKSFGFDVCKYIAKNKVISFDESEVTPQYDNIENLCLWAIFHPSSGDFAYSMASPPGYNPYTSINKSFYQLNVMSYAEYEDA